MGRYWAILYALIVSFSGLVTAQDVDEYGYNYGDDYDYYSDDYNGTGSALEFCSAPDPNHDICQLWYYGDSEHINNDI